ncbi:MAG: MerR family transcriptional regulator [Planctomycetota bacterium]
MTTPASKLLKTKEVLARAGIHRQMFYHYLGLGLIREATRLPSGHRLFDETVLKRLALIRELNGSGYSLRDIKETFKTFAK